MGPRRTSDGRGPPIGKIAEREAETSRLTSAERSRGR